MLINIIKIINKDIITQNFKVKFGIKYLPI